jgi:hypothetical protein
MGSSYLFRSGWNLALLRRLPRLGSLRTLS